MTKFIALLGLTLLAGACRTDCHVRGTVVSAPKTPDGTRHLTIVYHPGAAGASLHTYNLVAPASVAREGGREAVVGDDVDITCVVSAGGDSVVVSIKFFDEGP